MFSLVSQLDDSLSVSLNLMNLQETYLDFEDNNRTGFTQFNTDNLLELLENNEGSILSENGDSLSLIALEGNVFNLRLITAEGSYLSLYFGFATLMALYQDLTEQIADI